MLAPETVILDRFTISYLFDDRPRTPIYRAVDQRDGRRVLVCAVQLDTPELRDDVPALASQVAALNISTVLPLIAHTPFDSQYLLVCGEPDGADLDRALRERGRPFGEYEVLSRFDALLAAIDELHRQRPPLYLGDLRSSDLWVLPDGQLRLAPYALISPIGSEPSPYRAPEATEVNPENAACSDIYALGAVLYQLLTGWAPPGAPQRLAGTPMTMPRQLNPNLSALCEQGLLRALELKTSNRYQLAREMRVALDTIRMVGGKHASLEAGLPPPGQTAAGQPATAQPSVTVRLEPAPDQAPTDPPATPPPGVTPPTLATAPNETPTGPLPAQPAPPAAAVYQTPLPSQPAATPAQPPRQQDNTCLVVAAIALTLMLIGICVLGIALAFFLPNSPLRGVLGLDAGQPAATAVAVGESTAVATPLPGEPTSPPASPAGAITLANAGTLTQTDTLTSTHMGPGAYAPGGEQMALAINNLISLREADTLAGVRTLEGHTGLVGPLAYSPDGTRLASGALGDPLIRVWDPASGELITTLSLPSGEWVRSLAFSPDGTLLASGDTSGTIRVWAMGDFSELRRIDAHQNYLGGIAFAPDGTRLLSASRDGTARMWEVATGQELEQFRFESGINPTTAEPFWLTGVAFARDGARYAVGGTDSQVHVFDASTGDEVLTLSGHDDWITLYGLDFSADGRLLASASLDGTVRVWDVLTGAERQVLARHRLQVVTVRFSPNGRGLMSISDEGGELFTWDLQNDSPQQVLRIGQGLVTALAYAPGSQFLGTTGINGNLRIYDVATRESVGLTGATIAAQSVAFVSDNQIATINDAGGVTLYDLDSAGSVAMLGLEGPVLAVAASPTGLLAAGSASGRIAVWGDDATSPLALVDGPEGGVLQLGFSGDGRTLVAVGTPSRPVIQLWDIRGQRLIATLAGHNDLVTGIAFQPGTNDLATTGRDGTLRLWSTSTGEQLRAIESDAATEGWFTGVSFSPDGGLMLTGSAGGLLAAWDAATGERLATIVVPPRDRFSPTAVLAISFRPDGNQVAVSLRDGTVRLFEVVLPS